MKSKRFKNLSAVFLITAIMFNYGNFHHRQTKYMVLVLCPVVAAKKTLFGSKMETLPVENVENLEILLPFTKFYSTNPKNNSLMNICRSVSV